MALAPDECADYHRQFDQREALAENQRETRNSFTVGARAKR
jgi:hypothetical protein